MAMVYVERPGYYAAWRVEQPGGQPDMFDRFNRATLRKWVQEMKDISKHFEAFGAACYQWYVEEQSRDWLWRQRWMQVQRRESTSFKACVKASQVPWTAQWLHLQQYRWQRILQQLQDRRRTR